MGGQGSGRRPNPVTRIMQGFNPVTNPQNQFHLPNLSGVKEEAKKTSSVDITAVGEPGGSSNDIQYNNAGSFGGATGYEIASGTFRIDDGYNLAFGSNYPTNNWAVINYNAGSSSMLMQTGTGIDITIDPSVNTGDLYLRGDTIYLQDNTITFGDGTGDVTFNFNAGTNDGLFYWDDSADKFVFSDDLLMTTTERIYFYDTSASVYATSQGKVKFEVAGLSPEFNFGTSSISYMKFSNSGVIINDNGQANFDVRMEGDTDTWLFTLDSGLDSVGIGEGTPKAKFDVDGSHALALATVTGNTTLDIDDSTVLCNSASALTITLPAGSSCEGRIYCIKNINTGVVTVDGNGGDTIDGSLTVALSSQYDAITIQSDGTNWYILSTKP